MTIKIVKGNLLDSDADIILHQVNLQGVMGGGVAYQIATRFPAAEDEYLRFKHKRLGEVCFALIGPKKWVANCFSQRVNFETDYVALKKCCERVIDFMKTHSLRSAAIPFNYGCGIANGDWNKVYTIFEKAFEKSFLQLYIYKLRD